MEKFDANEQSSFLPRSKRSRKRKKKNKIFKYVLISLIMTSVYFLILVFGVKYFEPIAKYLNYEASGQILTMTDHETKQTSIATKAPFPEPVYEISINKSNNLLTVYMDGKVMQTFPVATGMYRSLTPEGTFQIVNKILDPWYVPQNIPGGAPNNPLGHFWLGLNVPGTDGSIYGIHGTNNPNSIGKYVSAGCIRMYNDDVRWIYENVPLYSTVTIHY